MSGYINEDMEDSLITCIDLQARLKRLLPKERLLIVAKYFFGLEDVELRQFIYISGLLLGDPEIGFPVVDVSKKRKPKHKRGVN